MLMEEKCQKIEIMVAATEQNKSYRVLGVGSRKIKDLWKFKKI